MIDDDDLGAAVAAGVLDAPTAAALRSFAADRHRLPAVDEEHFRLVSGFNDIFVALASMLLLVALGWLGLAASPWGGGAAVAAASWLLAEPFVRRRRMALPALVLTAAFVAGVIVASRALLDDARGTDLLALAAGVPAAVLHWRHFRVPFGVAAGMAAGLAALLAAWVAVVPIAYQMVPAMLMLGGVAAFALAMHHDLADRERRTRRADTAFWLHLLAAPLLVHPVFSALALAEGPARPALSAAALLLYGVLALLSLAIDRRALMVSALGYVLYAASALAGNSRPGGQAWAFTATILGAALLLLSAQWQPARQRVISWLGEGWRSRLPPLR